MLTVTTQIEVRLAQPRDSGAISKLVMDHARRGDVLPRSLDSIRETIDDWVVVTVDGKVVACGSLLMYGPGLAEVRSLAVANAHKGQGHGQTVVRTLISMGRARDLHTLFALTRAVRFFEGLGFTVTTKEQFPEKVWRDCTQCPIMDKCDETAVVLPLTAQPTS